jgi:hypothetical protein
MDVKTLARACSSLEVKRANVSRDVSRNVWRTEI